MSKISFLVLVFITSTNSLEFVFKPGPLIPATKGEVWPKPQSVEYSNKYYTFLPSFFRFKLIGKRCKTLEEALDRYRDIILFHNRRIKQVYYSPSLCFEPVNPNFLGYFTNFEVDLIEDCNDEEYPSFQMKEEYNLVISENERRLNSSTIWGIIRGLETFSQLIYLTDDYSCHRVASARIHDFPRLAHRGLLLDTSRHYHSKETIFRLLDAMSYNKLNVFHWHITDDYSFPYVSKAFPELSQKGAFHPTLMIYEAEFVQEVQEYARKRGIRVMVEFDTPGHTLSWGFGNPDLLTKCFNVPELEWGPINPIKDSTYEFIFKLFDEIHSVFKDDYTHLGGDEVDFECWKSNPEVTSFMSLHNITSYPALQSLYIQKLVDYVHSLDLNSIVWEEVFTNGVLLPKSTIINVWISDVKDPRDTLSEVTAAGHPVIISAWWYLNLLNTGGDWVKFYNADPYDFAGTEEQKSLVIGAEACMWSEVVDENNLESLMWPRAAAAAEKFWSQPEPRIATLEDVFPVGGRLQEQTCRMNRRGIRAQPPTGPSVCF